ncbi:MAG: DUF2497 domain-containing protein [Proteobacteria bacterium]|nr:DUF2497 domain-containing protein [Pseudomonadota bacterium]
MSELKTDQEPSIEEILESIRQIISEDGETGTNPAAAAKSVTAATPQQQSPKEAPLPLVPENATAVPASTLDLSAQTPVAAPVSTLNLSGPPGSKAKPAEIAQSQSPSKPVSPLELSMASAKNTTPVGADILDLTDKVNSDKTAASQQLSPHPPRSAMTIEMMDKPIMDNPMTTDKPPVDTLISAQTAAAATESLSKLLASNIAVEKEDVAHVGKITLEDITREVMKPMIKAWLDQNLPGIIEKVVQREVEKLSRRAMDR